MVSFTFILLDDRDRAIGGVHHLAKTKHKLTKLLGLIMTSSKNRCSLFS